MIRFGITARLFLAILLTSLAVALAMAMAVRFSFHTGFTQYLEERDTQRASLLTSTLTELYRDQGGWGFLRDEPRLWWRIVRTATAIEGRGRGERDEPVYAQPPPFSLLDAQGSLIAGPRSGNHHGHSDNHEGPRYAVEVDGTTVGWLVRQPMPQAPDALDQRFASQQRLATYAIVALAALLAAAVSLLLARTLRAPIRRIGEATHRLAAGDYGIRVTERRRDELGQLANDFNQLATTLERNERLRRELMADISHELRTPLAVLRGELEALQDGVRRLDAASLASLQHEVGRLSQLIDDLHELALADAGALNYRKQKLDLRDIVRAAAQAYAERMASRQLAFDIHLADEPAWMQGDAQRLDQLLHNLLENSLRYTDPGGRVELSLNRSDDRIVLVLRDSAPGVPTALLPRLFERLFRVEHSRNRESGGSGLGLAISQRIVEAHGGRIEALPSALGGVEIRLELPAE